MKIDKIRTTLQHKEQHEDDGGVRRDPKRYRRVVRRIRRRRREIRHSDRSNSNAASRRSFADATSLIMKQLAEDQRPHSISGLSRDAQLHRKTVEKVIELLFELEKNWLDTYRVRLDNLDDRRRIVSLERRTGLLSYPKEAQSYIIRSKYFPIPSKETSVMTYLYLKDATTPEKAISLPEGGDREIEDGVTRRLVKQGKIIEQGQQQQGGGRGAVVGSSSRGLFYLSKEGITIAKGALQVYPELEQELREK